MDRRAPAQELAALEAKMTGNLNPDRITETMADVKEALTTFETMSDNLGDVWVYLNNIAGYLSQRGKDPNGNL